MRSAVVLLATVAACSSGAVRSDSVSAAQSGKSLSPGGAASAGLGIDSVEAMRLVEEYARRDAAGERLSSSDWFKNAIVEPDHEPGYDSFTAIKQYEVKAGRRVADTLQVPVIYHVVGAVEQTLGRNKAVGLKLVAHDTTESVMFPVVRSPDGKMRIVSPQIDQHVLAAAILSNQRLSVTSASDRQLLKAAAATPR